MCRQHIKQLANVGAKTVSNLGTFLHRAGQRAGQTVKVKLRFIQSGLQSGSGAKRRVIRWGQEGAIRAGVPAAVVQCWTLSRCSFWL